MKIYPEQKPSLMEITLPIVCALLSNPHYTFSEDETGKPELFKSDNGKNWKEEKDDSGRNLLAGRYTTTAVEDAISIAREILRELDLEEEFQKD